MNQPNLHFSISHSGPYWACAMTGGSVGLDIQEHTTLKNESRAEAADRYSRMASRFFHPSEAAYVRSEAREDCYNRFFQVWTARESYVKYTGLGIDRDFGQLCVIPAAGLGTPGVSAQNDPFSCPPAEPHRFLSWQAEGAFFLETEFPENFTLCLCTEKQAEVLLLPMIQASDGTFPGSPHG